MSITRRLFRSQGERNLRCRQDLDYPLKAHADSEHITIDHPPSVSCATYRGDKQEEQGQKLNEMDEHEVDRRIS